MNWLRKFQSLVVVALLAGFLSAGGCGYTHQALYPSGISTVQVKIFENRTFYRDVEFDLTEAIVKEIELKTPYKSKSQDGADTLLEGRIVDIQQKRLSRTSSGGLTQEMEVTVTIDFEWRDLESGKVLRQRSGVADVGTYKPARPIGEPFEVAQHMAVQRVASRIVSAMRDDF